MNHLSFSRTVIIAYQRQIPAHSKAASSTGSRMVMALIIFHFTRNFHSESITNLFYFHKTPENHKTHSETFAVVVPLQFPKNKQQEIQ